MDAEIFIESGAVSRSCEKLGALVPELSRVFVLCGGGKNDDMALRALSRRYRTVSLRKDAVRKAEPCEDARAVVAIDCEDEGKYLAARFSLPLVLVLTKACSPSALLPVCRMGTRGGYRERFAACSPCLLVCDYELLSEDEHDVACGYGIIASSLASLFELKARAATEGYELPVGYSSEVSSIAGELFKQKKPNARCVAELSIRLAKASQSFGVRPVGGHYGFCEALGLMDDGGLTEGERLLLSSVIVVRSYVAFLAFLPSGGVKTRSGNARIDGMAASLKVAPVFFSKRMAPALPRSELDKRLYCTQRARSELLGAAIAAEKALTFAFSNVKRLYKDKGFSYNKYPGRSKAAVALALAPELSEGLLSLLSELGLLERYL